MRLIRFKASGVHGYLKFNIKFNESISFITGINGSGKTSALNIIVALITPNLSVLANLQFDNSSIEIENDGNIISISCIRNENEVILSVSNVDDRLVFSKFLVDEDIPPSRQDEAESQYFRELMSIHVAHPVLRSIEALPTPMFLGLDRRARFEEETARFSRYLPRRPRRVGRNVFGASLARSLEDAAALAETRYRDALIESGNLAETLQRELLLSLLTFDARGDSPFGTISAPTKSDLAELANVRRDLETLPQILHLPRNEVRRRITPFLDALQRYADTIPSNSNASEILGANRDEKIVHALLNWSSKQDHLVRIKSISSIVSKYNDSRRAIFDSMTTYLGLVTRFLQDGKKSVQFNDRGYIYVKIDGVSDEREISSLSSGEAQIFVILTHLSFNKYAQKNVFIIDEPELSLHIHWQEMFVESIISANPNIQYVMSTHSPSIILDRVDDCIDISSVRSRKRRA